MKNIKDISNDIQDNYEILSRHFKVITDILHKKQFQRQHLNIEIDALTEKHKRLANSLDKINDGLREIRYLED